MSREGDVLVLNFNKGESKTSKKHQFFLFFSKIMKKVQKDK